MKTYLLNLLQAIRNGFLVLLCPIPLIAIAYVLIVYIGWVHRLVTISNKDWKTRTVSVNQLEISLLPAMSMITHTNGTILIKMSGDCSQTEVAFASHGSIVRSRMDNWALTRKLQTQHGSGIFLKALPFNSAEGGNQIPFGPICRRFMAQLFDETYIGQP
jgi:hypothetical protein